MPCLKGEAMLGCSDLACGQATSALKVSESDSDYDLLPRTGFEGLSDQVKTPADANLPPDSWDSDIEALMDNLVYGEPVRTECVGDGTAAGLTSGPDPKSSNAHTKAFEQHHSGHPCDDGPSAYAGLDGWLLPESYHDPICQPRGSRCSSPTPAPLCGGMLGTSEGHGLCPSHDFDISGVDWDSLDMYGAPATSMSCRLSNIESEQLHQFSPMDSQPTTSCHRSLSPHPAEGSVKPKTEPEMEQEFEAGSGGLTDSGSFQAFAELPPSAATEVATETRSGSAAPSTRAPSLPATSQAPSKLPRGNSKPKRRVSTRGQVSKQGQQVKEEPRANDGPRYRTTASGRPCNPRPVYVDETDEDTDAQETEEEEENGAQDVELSESDADDSEANSDDEDFDGSITTRSGRSKRGAAPGRKCIQRCPVHRKVALEYVGSKVKYRGVTRKVNGRFEAQLHDALDETHDLRGEQVYLGVYIDPERAAAAYDRAALKFLGKDRANLNLVNEDYDNPVDKRARDLLSSRQYLAYLKANSDAERGKSGFHGVAMRTNNRWQARITGIACFGTFPNKEDAAHAYDLGSIHLYGEEAVLNYPIFDYWDFEKGRLKRNLPWPIPEAAKAAVEAAGSKPHKKRKRSIKAEQRIKEEKRVKQETHIKEEQFD